jgi:NitT/TauT family transport system substrate-binding protein
MTSPLVRWLCSGLVVLGVLACAPSPAPPAAPSPAAPAAPVATPAARAPDAPLTVRVGTTGALAEAGQYLALDRGYFAEEGLQIEYVPFDAAARMIPALGADQLDVGGGGVSAGLFNAIARGVGIRIVGPQARHEPGQSSVYLTVRRDLVDGGLVRDYADLRGRVLAIAARASVNEYAAHLVAERGGFAPADLQLVELGFGEMVTALANGAIDAAIQAEPTVTVAVERGVATRWREIADLNPRFQFTVVLYSPTFAGERAEAARRWMVAYLRGVRDYTDAFRRGKDRSQVVEVLTRWTPIKDPAVYDRMGFTAIDPNGEVDRPSLEGQLRWLAAQGLLQGEVTLEQVLDPSFARYAVERLGRY